MSAPRPARPLRDALRQAYIVLALVGVTLAGLSLTLAGLAALRVYAQANLALVARSMAYTAEAAVVFRDAAAAQEILAAIAPREDVAEARILDEDSAVLATWERPSGDLLQTLGERATRLMRLAPVVVPIQRDGRDGGRVVGRVVLRGSGAGLMRFLTTGLLAIAACLGLATAASIVLSRRLLDGILTPLGELARVARAVHRDRAFGERVPPARILELRELGEDFNALLAELAERQDHLVRQNASLAHQANHDGLTGLPNRAFFTRQLQAALQAAEAGGHAIAVLFLDNDHFKQVNDTHGHAAGDALLTAVAARVRAQLRDSDLVARLGGDEFAVLLAPLRGADDALRIADKILAAMALPLRLDSGASIRPSVSIGVAVFPDHARDADSLLRSADQAMYRAKADLRGSRHLAALPVPDGTAANDDDKEMPLASPR